MANRPTSTSTSRGTRRRRERDAARAAGIPKRSETAPAVAGASVGLAAGAAIGAFAGPIGVVAGGALGAVAGAASGAAISEIDGHRARHDRKLDEDIGVVGGSLGVAPEMLGPPEPSSRVPAVGTFSASSAGVGGTGGSLGVGDPTPAEGGIPKAD